MAGQMTADCVGSREGPNERLCKVLCKDLLESGCTPPSPLRTSPTAFHLAPE